MEFVWPVSTESVGRASCEMRSHRRRDATRQFRRVGVGSVYGEIFEVEAEAEYKNFRVL